MKQHRQRNVLLVAVRSLRPCRRPQEEGASLVEFAIVLPVFALMLFGMIQFGLAFVGWDQLRNAVQTGARLAANTSLVSPNPNCAQTDPGDNMVCQIALLIGAPVDTNPTSVASLSIPSQYTCTLTASASPQGSSLQACTTSDGNGGDGYAWLDGYYIFSNGQWRQIVANSTSSTGPPPPGQTYDTEAFQYGVETWTCNTTQNGTCTGITTDGTSGTPNLGSDNVSITIQNSELDVCAQRQLVSFTAFPGGQNIHLSTTSTFLLPQTSPLTATATTTYPNGSSCG